MDYKTSVLTGGIFEGKAGSKLLAQRRRTKRNKYPALATPRTEKARPPALLGSSKAKN
jgi:hypothetical protein